MNGEGSNNLLQGADAISQLSLTNFYKTHKDFTSNFVLKNKQTKCVN